MKIRAALVVLLLSRAAFAEERIVTLDRTCVQIDGAVDGLAATDREHATQLLQRVLERKDLFVVSTECKETYTLSHEQIDHEYVIRVSSSKGKRRMKTPALVELSAKYDKMVRSLIEAKVVVAQPAVAQPPVAQPAVAEAPQAADDPFAAAEPQIAPAPQVAVADNALEPVVDAEMPSPSPSINSINAPSVWYALAGLQLTGGNGFALGYRRALTNFTLDISGSLRTSHTDSAGAGIGAELLKKKILSPRSAAYAGGGISFGAMAAGDGEGGGVQGELTAGLGFGFTDQANLLVQFDLTLPFYRVSNEFGEKSYAALAVLSGGVAW